MPRILDVLPDLPTAAGLAAMSEPTHSLEEADLWFRQKYSLPDLSSLTEEELSAYAEQSLAKVAPEKIAEAERLGLI